MKDALQKSGLHWQSVHSVRLVCQATGGPLVTPAYGPSSAVGDERVGTCLSCVTPCLLQLCWVQRFVRMRHACTGQCWWQRFLRCAERGHDTANGWEQHVRWGTGEQPWSYFEWRACVTLCCPAKRLSCQKDPRH